MPIRNTAATWGWPSRLLHWSMAGVLVFMLGLGFYMANLVPDVYEQFSLTQMHKSWGFVAFALVCVRLVWRLANPTPVLPDAAPDWQRKSARAGHALLYVCMLALPLSGWLMASASPLQDTYGIRNMVFGQFELPDPFVPGSAALAEALGLVHRITGIVLAVLVAGHAAMALRHAIVQRDGVLRRMIAG